VLIRPVRLHEAHAVAQVHVQADRETYAPIFGASFREVAFERSLQRWQTALAAGDVFLAAEAEARIVGFAHSTDTWMSALYLLAPHVRQGIGSRLVEAVRSELRARGVREVGFTAVAQNAGALAFYAAMGAQPVERRWEGEGAEAWENIDFVLPI